MPRGRANHLLQCRSCPDASPVVATLVVLLDASLVVASLVVLLHWLLVVRVCLLDHEPQPARSRRRPPWGPRAHGPDSPHAGGSAPHLEARRYGEQTEIKTANTQQHARSNGTHAHREIGQTTTQQRAYWMRMRRRRDAGIASGFGHWSPASVPPSLSSTSGIAECARSLRSRHASHPRKDRGVQKPTDYGG